MDNCKNSTRLKRIGDDLADSAERKVKEVGRNMIEVFISDVGSSLMSFYENFKKSRSFKLKYKELERYIEANNETVQIGMDKKEIAVLWAMRKLGYTEEETKEVLDLANKAYLPKE